MKRLTELLSKPIISLYQGKTEGTIKNALFNKELTALKWLVVFDDKDILEQKYIEVKEIFNIGNDAVVIKNSQNLLPDITSTRTYKINPINHAVYNAKGDFVGKVCDVLLTDKFKTSYLELNNKTKLNAEKLLVKGEGALILQDSNSPIQISNFKPKKVPNQQEEHKTQQVKIMSVNNNLDKEKAMPQTENKKAKNSDTKQTAKPNKPTPKNEVKEVEGAKSNNQASPPQKSIVSKTKVAENKTTKTLEKAPVKKAASKKAPVKKTLANTKNATPNKKETKATSEANIKTKPNKETPQKQVTKIKDNVAPKENKDKKEIKENKKLSKTETPKENKKTNKPKENKEVNKTNEIKENKIKENKNEELKEPEKQPKPRTLKDELNNIKEQVKRMVTKPKPEKNKAECNSPKIKINPPTFNEANSRPVRIVSNCNFLLKRIATKQIQTNNGEIIVKAGEKITQKIIEFSFLSGKLQELIRYSAHPNSNKKL